VIVDINQEITEDLAVAIQAAGIERVKIRSVLTCESKRVSAYVLRTQPGLRRLVELGEATGVIAAQSIGNLERSLRCVPSTSVVPHREFRNSRASMPRATARSASSGCRP